MLEENNQRLSESIEDYIERIYMELLNDSRGVRITDLAEAMNVSKASANDAVKRLQKLGYVEHEKYRQIYLTEMGEKKAAQIYDRHTTITCFINQILGIDLETAEKDACSIEHSISEETFLSLKKLVQEYEQGKGNQE